jgi:hypothetical protein
MVCPMVSGRSSALRPQPLVESMAEASLASPGGVDLDSTD